jgi:hypothetical protein
MYTTEELDYIKYLILAGLNYGNPTKKKRYLSEGQ